MSINAKYRRITPQELAAFQSDPSSIAAFFGTDTLDKMPDDDDEDFDEEAFWAQPSLGTTVAGGRPHTVV